ncbi:MAG: Transposase DDE domain protein [Lentisphaerae bacterium ADurb.Bin082]|nr:MAG: Transposase DDE domain protein [Lentisphaerae bacterium ADurb.Bin082]
MTTTTSNLFIRDDISGWDDFIKCLPANWREIVASSNVLKGQRKDKSPETLLHTLMLHLMCGYSLRETSAIAAEAGIAFLSDVALLKRLRKSTDMFKRLCSEMFCKFENNEDFTDYRIRLIDGTVIKEPGQFGTKWRIHYSFLLPEMACDSFKLTKATGPGTGEGLEQFEVKSNDIMLADRGFCRFNCLNHVAKGGGFSCVRWNSGALPLYNADGSAFNIKNLFKALASEGMCGEANVFIHGDAHDGALPCRVCVIRKNGESAARARKLLRREAAKKHVTPTQLSLLACDFIVLVTTLPPDRFDLRAVLELYRLRWQVELVFKRFKSIARIGALPKYTDSSAEAWLYGKMFVTLMVERLSSQLGAFSPWRAVECSCNTPKLMERIRGIVSYHGAVGDSGNKTG